MRAIVVGATGTLGREVPGALEARHEVVDESGGIPAEEVARAYVEAVEGSMT